MMITGPSATTIGGRPPSEPINNRQEVPVGLGKLRRYDVQATWAIASAAAAAAPFLAAAYLAVSRFDGVLGQIRYGAQGRFVPAFLGCVALSGMLAALGFVLGWNSAGQRRNDKSRRSWTGFFLGGLIATLDLVLMIAFMKLRLEV
jgi:hypothetical protein